MTTIQPSFFTPIEWAEHSLISLPARFLNLWDGEVAEVVSFGNGFQHVQRKEVERPWVSTVLKLVLWVGSAGILSLLALALNAIVRCVWTFHWIDENLAERINVIRERFRTIPINTDPNRRTIYEGMQVLLLVDFNFAQMALERDMNEIGGRSLQELYDASQVIQHCPEHGGHWNDNVQFLNQVFDNLTPISQQT